VGGVSAKRSIPITPIMRRYRRLRRAHQAARLAEARRLLADPNELAAEFAASVAHFSPYDNRREPFYPPDRAVRAPGDGIAQTNDLVLRIERQRRIVPVDAAARIEEHDAGPAVKILGDTDPFFALVQALACAAHLATPNQYERMRRHLYRGAFPTLPDGPRLDIAILLYDGHRTGQPSAGAYMGELTATAGALGPKLLAQDTLGASVRRISAIGIGLDGSGRLDAEVRWAWERRLAGDDNASAERDGERRTAIPIFNDRAVRVRTMADWQRLAPPASESHWREHPSAMELARAWIEKDPARRIEALLAGRPRLAGVRLERAIAERKTFFDDIRSGPRNHDLLVHARSDAGPVVIGVEAKVDESFDRDLVSWREAAIRRQPATRAPERLDRLTRAFFGVTLDGDPQLGPLRYQLLAAPAGTLAEAREASAAAAVLLVHEFVTPAADPRNRARNGADLDRFLARLGGGERTGHDDGWLAGPFRVPGNGHLPGTIPVYVGKLVSHTASPA